MAAFMPPVGSLQLGGKHYSCVPGQSFAALDFGRGAWPLNTYWQRAAFAAAGGIAGNFGAGWLDHSGLSENSLWFGGKVQLLDSPLHIERSSQAPLAPWRLDSEDDCVALRFTPRQLHKACPNSALPRQHRTALRSLPRRAARPQRRARAGGRSAGLAG
jgi:hypothetical protein